MLISESTTNKENIQEENLQFAYSQKYVTHKTCTKASDLKMGRINVDISQEIEKQLRLKTVEKFGAKKATYPEQFKKQ